MGLFNRRRSARPAESPPAAPSADVPPAEVYRAGNLRDVPEWTKVPPPAPLLPEMPVVVSTHFDRSLATWQPPERFLAPLGHTVSTEAPSGMVEGIAVLAPAPISDPDPAPPGLTGEALPLAASTVQRSHAHRSPSTVISARSLPFGRSAAPSEVPELIEPAQSELPLAPGDPGPGPGPEPEAGAEPPAEIEAVDAGLIGSSSPVPIVQSTPVVQPMAVTEPLRPGPSRLVHAATPPDMPLANLPSAPLPAPAAGPRADFPAQEQGGAGLVGDQPIVQTRSESPRPSEAGVPAPEPAASPPDLPLAVPPMATGGEGPAGYPPPVALAGTTVHRLPNQLEVPAAPPEAGSEVEARPPAAMVGEEPGSALPPEQTTPAVQDHPAGPAEAVAPLVGLGPLIGAEPTRAGPGSPSRPPDNRASSPADHPLPVSRAQVQRSGLGEPMRTLPPTATSWDITTMSMDQQIRASRALIESQIRSGGRGGFPGPGPATRPTVPPIQRTVAPPERVFAGTPLRRAPIEPVGPAPAGVVPPDLLELTGAEAPLLAMDLPIAGEGSRAGSPAVEMGPEPAPVRPVVSRSITSPNTAIAHPAAPVDRPGPRLSPAPQPGSRMPTAISPPGTGPQSPSGYQPGADLPSRPGFSPPVPTGLPAEPAPPVTELVLAESVAARAVLPPPSLDMARPGRPVSPSGPEPVFRSGTEPVFRSGTEPVFRSGPEPGQTLPLAGPVPGGIDTDAVVATVIQRMSGLATTPPPGMEREVFTPATLQAEPAPVAPAQEVVIQRAEVSNQPAQWVSDTPDASGNPGMQRPSDEDLSNLSRWLYPLIKHRLKGELREDRERAGLLTDHYRKW